MNYKRLDNKYILHKIGIIINIETFELIYPKSHRNMIKYNNNFYSMKYFMIMHFNSTTGINNNITLENIYNIDDNIYNNSLDNLLYIENNILNQNLYLCNSVILYTITIEKYNYQFELIQRYTNLKRNIFSANFILKLLTYKYYIFDNHYWKLTINKIYLDNINSNILYKNIDNTQCYISNDKSHIIDKKNKKILSILQDKNLNYYSLIYYPKYQYYQKYYLEYFNFAILDTSIFEN